MSSLLRRFAALLVASAAVLPTGHGRTVLAEGYALRVWQTDDGLPENMVTAAAQTRDGYLWFGTYNGLARFDGERFHVFAPATAPGLRDRRIASLFEDARGTLWIGQEAGTIDRYREGVFESTAAPAGEKVTALGSDSAGALWAMRQNGALERLDDGAELPSLIAPALPGVMAWSRGTRGELWLAENGEAARLEAGRLRRVELPPPRSTNYVLTVAAARAGGAWILCDDRIRRWHEGVWAEDRGDYPWREGPVACSLELGDGTLAVGTIYSGLYLIFKDSRPPVHIDRRNGLPQDWIRFLHEDREGTLWAGAGSAGLVSLHATPVSVLESPDRWQGCTVLSVAAARDGALWIGTEGGGLYRHEAGQWRRFAGAEGLENLYVPAIAEDTQGRVWAGNFWWGGPTRLENGRFRRPPGVPADGSPVFALAPTPAEMLVGNCDGLLAVGAHESRWLARVPGPTAGGVCAIVRGPGDSIWCGFGETGIARIAAGRPEHFRKRDGLASDAVKCLALGQDGALWIGTADQGLSRFKDGRFATVGPSQGLIDSGIGFILDDGRGNFWLSTHRGLQQVSQDELNRCADGELAAVSGRLFDRNDGLPASQFTGGLQAAACRTADGRLWFASSQGVVGVDPARLERNAAPPPVVIQSLLVDGAERATPASMVAAALAPDHRRLEFRFAGLSYVAPHRVQFRYRLDGIDPAWVDAGTRHAAFYSRLPAGRYRFRVIACNDAGLWNETGAELAFAVAPFFWQTWWFVTATLLATGAGIAWAARRHTRRRMQREIERVQRQREIERERTRIAQDIHDDIGASLSRIAMLSGSPPGDDVPAGRTSTLLARIYAAAREMTRSLDEIVWAVDPKHDTLDSLVDYMGKFAHALLSAAQVRCRLDLPVEVPPRPLTAEVRHNLFLAYKEALNNAVKHAAATEVRVAVLLHGEAFEVVIHDDGRGLGAAAAGRPGSGNGLPNMRKRLTRVGGRCTVESTPGAGTRVALFVGLPRQPDTPPATQ
ncbi:MAG: two-component regulator propeller domain-containing protein [Opitutaceae bacterium]